MTHESFLLQPTQLLDEDRLLVFHADGVVCRDQKFLWHRQEVAQLLENDAALLDISVVHNDSSRHVLVHLPDQAELLQSFEVRSLRSVVFSENDVDIALFGRANQLLEWYRSHRFCGRCGSRTSIKGRQYSLHCQSCAQDYFPRINPCSIMLVVDGPKVLLARNARYRAGYYSCLAGFIEVGESAEECVAREVKEEVGLDVCNVRYVSSQSWPFPSQLMLGFFADYAGGEILCQPEEIEDAAWYHVDQLPSVPPAGVSVAGELIRRYVSLVQQGKV